MESLASTGKKKHASNYFTFWNLYIMTAVSCLVLFLYVPSTILHENGTVSERTHRVVKYIVVPLVVLTVSISFTVRMTIIDHALYGEIKDDMKKQLYSKLQSDYKIHFAPFLLGVVLFIVILSTTSLSDVESMSIFAVSIVYACILYFTWLMVPIEGDEPGTKLTLSKKVGFLYGYMKPANIALTIASFIAAASAQVILISKKSC